MVEPDQLPILPNLREPTVNITIGVLALQGAFAEHLHQLNRISNSSTIPSPVQINPILVKTATDLVQCSALVIPGGESTTMNLLASKQLDSSIIEPNQSKFRLIDWLKSFVRSGRAIFGTCAGLILLSDEVYSIDPKGSRGPADHLCPLYRDPVSLGGLPIKTIRNQYGNQLQSFEHSVQVPSLPDPETPFPAVFIRAPMVHTILADCLRGSSDRVDRLVVLPASSEHSSQLHLGPDHQVVGLSYKNILGLSFHPELTQDHRFHLYWVLNFVIGSAKPKYGTANKFGIDLRDE